MGFSDRLKVRKRTLLNALNSGVVQQKKKGLFLPVGQGAGAQSPSLSLWSWAERTYRELHPQQALALG